MWEWGKVFLRFRNEEYCLSEVIDREKGVFEALEWWLSGHITQTTWAISMEFVLQLEDIYESVHEFFRGQKLTVACMRSSQSWGEGTTGTLKIGNSKKLIWALRLCLQQDIIQKWQNKNF